MQIKSGKGVKPNNNNKRNNNKVYYPKKVKINNSADLYKLPVSVIKNTKIYNFSGKYFDEIYEEALKLERNNGMKKMMEAEEQESIEGEKYAKRIEEISNKLYSQNLIQDIKIEQIDNNIYSFNNKEITLKFDKNNILKLSDGRDLEKWLINTFSNK